MNLNVSFSRRLLKFTLEEVLGRFPGTDVRDAWVIATGCMWKFHFEKFYWAGTADNAYDARVKGWEAWLRERAEP